LARPRWLAKTLLYLTLEFGALVGVPMRVDEIEELTRLMNNTQVVQLLERDDDGDPPETP